MSLGEVFDTFTVTVNGRTMPIDQISAEGDAGPYLRAGKNTIVVRVATTLNNRLAKIDDDVANRGLVQPYGLVGPVRLTPYGTAAVWRNTIVAVGVETEPPCVSMRVDPNTLAYGTGFSEVLARKRP